MSDSYFHVQLGAILDVVVKSALVEICALADSVFSSLQEELQKCSSENQDLRRKLQRFDEEQNVLADPETLTVRTSDRTCRTEDDAVRNTDGCKQTAADLGSDATEVEGDLGNVELQRLNPPLEEIKEELMEMCVTQSVENTVDAVSSDGAHAFPVMEESCENVQCLDLSPEIKTESENKVVLHSLQPEWKDGIPEEYEEENESSQALERDLETENLSFQHVPCTQSKKQLQLGLCLSRAPDWHCNVSKTNITARASISHKSQAGSTFICNICGKTVLSKQGLRVHLKVHAGQRPYTCPQCGKSFTRKATLNFHQNIHTGAKPYGCNICPKSFADPSALRRHKSIHKGVS